MTRPDDGNAVEQSDPGSLEADVLSSPALLDAAFELFRDDDTALVELDSEHRIQRCNRGYAAACGCRPAELEGCHPADLFTIHLVNPSGSTRHESISTPDYPFVTQEEWLCRHGKHSTVTWLRLWILEDPVGPRYLKLGTCRDHASGPLDDHGDSRVQLQTFLDAAPDAIITINRRGEMISVNPATERLFGYSRAELQGNNVSMLMPSPDRERHDEYIRRYLETGEARIIGVGREVYGRRKDGSTLPVRLSVSEFEAHGSRYFTGMLHDISDRIEAEQKQREMFTEHAHASRVVALGEMASSIAHEINQPLTAIISYSDASRRLIETDKTEPETLRHALNQISVQGQRAGEIIRRLREFVKKKEPKRNAVDITELIESAAALTAHDAQRYGIDLEFNLEPRSLTTVVDKLQIEQVILNLLRNSIESIRAQGNRSGRIIIQSRVNGDFVEISVRDNGHGIAPSEMARIFDPFYTTKEKGTGLGLSISQSIAGAHGGDLILTPNEREGATSILTLPVSVDD